MSFGNIIGQKRAINILTKSVTQHRIAGGYLFNGPEGTGKEAVALEFAKLLFCDSMFEKPCGTCSACKRIAALNHPDVIFVVPRPKTASPEDIRTIYDSLAANPYLRARLWASPVIGIDQVRELRKKCSVKPTEQRRVIIIAEAEKMTAEAANSLLKLLEEPPDSTHLILTTSRPNQLLPTIISRCQEVKFGLLSEKEIEEALIARQELAREKARLISRISQGSFRRALEMVDMDLQERRELAVEWVRTSLRGNLDKFRLIERTLEKYDKQTVKDMLSLMLIWFRDALIFANDTNGAAAEQIVNVDQIETLQKFTAAFGQINYNRAFEEIEKAIEMIDRNVQVNLILMVLFNRLQKVLAIKG